MPSEIPSENWCTAAREAYTCWCVHNQRDLRGMRTRVVGSELWHQLPSCSVLLTGPIYCVLGGCIANGRFRRGDGCPVEVCHTLVGAHPLALGGIADFSFAKGLRAAGGEGIGRAKKYFVATPYFVDTPCGACTGVAGEHPPLGLYGVTSAFPLCPRWVHCQRKIPLG
jgi:hypothetical protein